MPAAIAIPLAIAGGSAAAGIVGAKMQSGAAHDAATAESSAAKYAADQQTKANAEALAFSKQQGENAFQNTEAARQGNYGMYAAAQRRLGSIGSLIGAAPREIPDYVPGVDPHFDGSAATPGAPSSGGAAPGIDPSKGDLAGQISAYFKSRGVSDQETPYWVQKWGEFGSKDPAYFNSRLAQADIFGKGGAPTAPAGSAASYLLPSTRTTYAQVPIAPGVQMPGSAASYLN